MSKGVERNEKKFQHWIFDFFFLPDLASLVNSYPNKPEAKIMAQFILLKQKIAANATAQMTCPLESITMGSFIQ